MLSCQRLCRKKNSFFRDILTDHSKKNTAGSKIHSIIMTTSHFKILKNPYHAEKSCTFPMKPHAKHHSSTTHRNINTHRSSVNEATARKYNYPTSDQKHIKQKNTSAILAHQNSRAARASWRIPWRWRATPSAANPRTCSRRRTCRSRKTWSTRRWSSRWATCRAA